MLYDRHLKAIHNISKLENWNIEEVILSSNRAISMGEGLEKFVKNVFADTFKIENQNENIYFFSEIFSFMKVQKELHQI